MTEGYNLKNRPPAVPLEQWKTLIKFWKSDHAKACSKKNKISRAKYTSIHTTGSKTFAEIRDEETTKNPNGKELSQVEMYYMTHKTKDGIPMNEETNRIVSELKDATALHPEASEQSSRDDVLSQVLGKDRHGYVRTYGKGVIPSDLWGSRSQLQTQKVFDEVKRNAQEEIRSMQEKMEEEMKVKLQEQVEVIKTEMLGGFKLILTQLQNCFPGVVIPDLSSISIPNLNEGQAAAQNIPEQSHTTVGSKKRKVEKVHKKRLEKESRVVKKHAEINKPVER